MSVTAQAAPLIAATGLHVHHGDLPVLHDIDLAVGAGEIVTLVGPNGSGKSTLIKALLGVVPTTKGRVERTKGLRIGYVPQSLALDGTLPMPVARFLSLPVRHSTAEINAALERTGVLVDPEALGSIRVEETIKEGDTIYVAAK